MKTRNLLAIALLATAPLFTAEAAAGNTGIGSEIRQEMANARKEMRIGEVITAEVVRIDMHHVVVNAGLKSESFVPLEEFKNDAGELEVQPGDFISVAIEALEARRGRADAEILVERRERANHRGLQAM